MRLIPTVAILGLLAVPALAQGSRSLPPPVPRNGAAPATATLPAAPAAEPGLGARTGAAIDRAAESTGQAVERAAESTAPAIGRALRWTGEQLQGAGSWTARQGERLTEPGAPAAQPATPATPAQPARP